jgi:hypothetical protein
LSSGGDAVGGGGSSSYRVRDLYKAMSHVQTHLVQSTEIAKTCLCPHLFKLDYPFGVTRAQGDYVVANTVHDIMSLALPSTILNNWQYGLKKENEYENIVRTIENKSSQIIDLVIAEKLDWVSRENRDLPANFEDDVRDRFHGLLTGFAKRIMKRYHKPRRILTEITITNTKNFHEGRLDAILEYSYGYIVIDWKAYDLDKVNSNEYEKWQLVANLLLANYRYTGSEDDWTKCLIGAVVYYGGAYIPRFPLPAHTIDKVKSDRRFDHEVLSGRSPPAKKPVFCPVCDTGAEACSDCRFYREDTALAYQGRLPDNYRRVRGLTLATRNRILEQRAETHRHKFVLDILTDKIGEYPALQELVRIGVVHCDYRFSSINGTIVTLKRNDTKTFLQPRKEIRIIGKENGGIPLLACINVQGAVRKVNGTELEVDLREITSTRRAIEQVFTLPIIIIPDEINLTRRMLEPLHRFHRLAADTMLPAGYFENNNSNGNGFIP